MHTFKYKSRSFLVEMKRSELIDALRCIRYSISTYKSETNGEKFMHRLEATHDYLLKIFREQK